MTRNILVTGATGQVGLELAALEWPADVVLHMPGRAELDLTSSAGIARYMDGRDFACVINPAAWTAVDAAEDNVADCFLANAQGPAWLAEAARRCGAAMVHVSTDYVFDGQAPRPYREDDPTGPVGAYGASKLAGEYAVRLANPRSVVLRTAWVLSRHRANFLKTMLRLGGERAELGVVADQLGCPTSAADIAAAIRTIALRLIEDADAPTGVYHFVNAGEANWHELASTIFALAATRGGPSPRVNRLTTDQFPTRARRPANSRLDTSRIRADFGIRPRDWREAVEDIVDQLAGDKIIQGEQA